LIASSQACRSSSSVTCGPGHQPGRLQLHQAGPDDQEGRQLVERWAPAFDFLEIVVGQACQRDRGQVDLGTLGKAEEQLDRTVEGGGPNQVDRILLDLGERALGQLA